MALTGSPALNIAIALSAVATGFVVAVVASKRAIVNTAELAAGTRLPRFVIGFTVLAIGTDLPEIANSIVSSITDHGDLNVGDSVGSAATQVTLVLGLLPIVAGAVFIISRGRFTRVGVATVGALLFGAALMTDGQISRMDALLLLVIWAAGTAFTFGSAPEGTQPVLPVPSADKLTKGAAALGALAVVGGGALVAVWGMTVLAEALSVPEYLIAFFLASIGTSLPELVVELTALRQGQPELAIGDAVGSSFVDSTLSIAAGPLIAPVAVTSSLVVRGSLVAAAAITLVIALLAIRRRHDWKTGIALILIYVAFYALLLPD